MTTVSLVVLADPATGDDAFGRVFNALAAAHDLRSRERPVRVVFQGAGTRWVDLLSRPDHPAHGLYRSVADVVAGASEACATVFGARDGVDRAGVALLADNPVPGTPGLASIAQFLADGPVLTF